jgi:hypothetical protein
VYAYVWGTVDVREQTLPSISARTRSVSGSIGCGDTLLPAGPLVHDVVAPFHVHDVVALVS